MDRETRDMLLETADRFFTERCGRDVVNASRRACGRPISGRRSRRWACR